MTSLEPNTWGTNPDSSRGGILMVPIIFHKLSPLISKLLLIDTADLCASHVHPQPAILRIIINVGNFLLSQPKRHRTIPAPRGTGEAQTRTGALETVSYRSTFKPTLADRIACLAADWAQFRRFTDHTQPHQTRHTGQ
jgi:hypothetical protein